MTDSGASPPAGDQTPEVRVAPPEEVAPRFSVGKLSRHVLVCAGPSCCDTDIGAQTWGVFKRAAARLQLEGKAPVFRTLCKCLRMCGHGPIVVVYPEGVWYSRVTPEAAEQIVREHLEGGRVVEELVFARDSLGDKRQGESCQGL